jgi:hypothetical protein
MSNLTVSNRFKFVIDSKNVGDGPFELSVVGANIPGMSLGVIQQPTPIRPINIPGDSLTFYDLTIDFIVDEEMLSWRELYTWIKAMKSSTEIDQNKVYHEASLTILSNKMNPLFAFKFMNLFPYVLGDIPMAVNIASSEPVMSTVSFKYQDVDIVDL